MELHHQAATPYLGTASGTVAVILRDVLSSEMANAAAEASAEAGGATTKEITTPAVIAARLTTGP